LSSLKIISRNLARLRVLSALRMSAPKWLLISFRPSEPTATTSRATISASIILMPNCSNLLLMADLPEPMPPVKPIIV
jgi:hypothetical protein